MKKILTAFIGSAMFLSACSVGDEGLSEERNEQVEIRKEAKDNVVTLKTFDLLEIGQTKEQVASILGNQYVKVASMTDGSPLWRYDIGAVDGYKFTGLGEVDVPGISNGILDMIVFVTWNDKGEASLFSACYMKEDGLIYEYVIFENGERGEFVLEN